MRSFVRWSGYGATPVSRSGMSTPLLILLLLPILTGCTLDRFQIARHQPPRVLHLATIFPLHGVDAPLGTSLQRAVVLAVRRHARLSRDYRLVVTHLDESNLPAGRIEQVLSKMRVIAMVGPLESPDVPALLPAIRKLHIATISPGATVPGPVDTRDNGGLQRARHGASRTIGKVPFFSLSPPDAVEGRTAADLAAAPAPGLAARTVFLVNDGSRAGAAETSAFAAELARKGGSAAGRRSLPLTDPDDVQSAVTAIIETHPDLVFYAGGTAAGADLRRTLSLTGAPQLRILAAGPIAGHPGWRLAVGNDAVAAATLALLPALPLSKLRRARPFTTIYRRTFPGKGLLPQDVLAYDAVMDEITAMKALIHEGKSITRRTVASTVAAMRYHGLTGDIAFDGSGNGVTPRDFSLYAYNARQGWHYEGSVR